MVLAVGTRQTWIVSAAGHGALLMIAQFGLPLFFHEPDPVLTVIPVEVVTISGLTTPPLPAAPEPKPEPKPAAAPPPPPQTPPEPPLPTPPPPKPKVTPPAPPPVPPAPKAPEPKPEAPKPELPKPVPPKPEPPKPEPPKAEKKPEPAPETQVAKAEPVAKPKPPTPTRDLSSILKDLTADKPDTQPKKAREVAAPDRKGETAPEQSRVSDMATATEIDALRVAIRRQIEPCWNPPAGARDAGELLVKILVYVEPSGQVRRAEVINAGLMASNPFFQAAAESARRAVLNPRCNPLKGLPTGRYNLWQELELTFNPKDALG